MSTNAFAAFEMLDLDQIKMKLMHVESGEGWSTQRAEAVESEYRRFLFLMKKYPEAEASPTVDVDTFWHYHILDTLKYARDCDAVFGYFLHHYPYVGIGASANDGDQLAGGERMRAIYEAEFGVTPLAGAAHAFCTSPNKPHETTIGGNAFCTSPNQPRAAANDAVAFCTSPNQPREAANAAYAFCTSPNQPREAANASYAFCTSPNQPREAASAAYAFCTSPNKPGEASNAAYAFCTSPNQPREAAKAAYAFCTSPNQPRVTATYAFCTSPNQPREAANAAYAFCTSPNKQARSEAQAA